MAVRLATPDDSADVARLMIAFRDWWGRDWPDDAAFAAGVEGLLADGNTDFLLASTDGEVLGVACVRYRYGLWQDAADACLEDVFVEEVARGRGLGEELVRAAVERALGRGCRRIELDVNDANEPALKLYERLGFDSYVSELGAHNRFMRLYF